VTARLWRVVAVYRVVTLAYATVLIIRDDGSYLHPATGFLMLAIMAVWTAVTIYLYPRAAGYRPWLLTADVGVAALLVLSTRVVDSAAQINGGVQTLPAFWAAPRAGPPSRGSPPGRPRS
jgi:uncharacterized protein DUF5931